MGTLRQSLYVFSRNLLRRSPFEASARASREARMAKDWRKRAYSDPVPPFVKTATLLEFRSRYNLSVFVETGTYLGDTLAFCSPHFSRAVSIEIDRKLYQAATRRFKGDPTIELLEGDSGEHITEVVRSLLQPALFWLDAHYSGGVTGRSHEDTPILREVRSILEFAPPPHVLLIDDAHCFGSWDGYPSVEELEAFVRKLRPELVVERAFNILRIHPGANTRSDR